MNQSRDAVGRAQACAEGTFLHRLLPKHARTGPALPACPLTQASRSQAGRSPTPPPPQPVSLPVQLQYGSVGWGRRRGARAKTTERNENSPPPDRALLVKPSPRVQDSLTQTFFSFGLVWLVKSRCSPGC